MRSTVRRRSLAIVVALWFLIPAFVGAEDKAPDTPDTPAAADTPTAAAAADAADAAVGHPPEVHDSFKEFCLVWMGKLVERERFNKTKIKWRPATAGVEGEYVGYSSEHTCDLRPPGSTGVPIGRLTYREMIYRKRGDSADTAQASDAEVIEITEITEIFRREKGKWLY